jgi:hypothetical protein
MITDPPEEWRTLKEHYARLSDEALKSLLEESSQLTDIAKETVRAEISSRGRRVQVMDTPPPVEVDFGLQLQLALRGLRPPVERRRSRTTGLTRHSGGFRV